MLKDNLLDILIMQKMSWRHATSKSAREKEWNLLSKRLHRAEVPSQICYFQLSINSYQLFYCWDFLLFPPRLYSSFHWIHVWFWNFSSKFSQLPRSQDVPIRYTYPTGWKISLLDINKKIHDFLLHQYLISQMQTNIW